MTRPRHARAVLLASLVVASLVSSARAELPALITGTWRMTGMPRGDGKWTYDEFTEHANGSWTGKGWGVWSDPASGTNNYTVTGNVSDAVCETNATTSAVTFRHKYTMVETYDVGANPIPSWGTPSGKHEVRCGYNTYDAATETMTVHVYYGEMFDLGVDPGDCPATDEEAATGINWISLLSDVTYTFKCVADCNAWACVSCTTSQYVENDECVDCPTGSISVGGNTRHCYCPENHARIVDAGEVHGYACYACDSGKFRAAGDIVPTSANDASTDCFTRVNHENWGRIAKFTSADPDMLRYDQYFGKSVAVHGNNMIVAASANVAESYSFERFSWYSRDPPPSEEIFEERLSLLIGETAIARDSSVAITTKSSNDAWIVFGSPRSNDAFIYACMNRICYQGKTSSGSNGLTTPTDAYFGQSVAIDGETVVVGASGMYWNEDGGHPTGGEDKKGSAYVFTPASQGDYNIWVLRATLRADDGLEGDQFGRSVAIFGDTIVVGAPGKSTDRNAYIFTRVDAGSPDSNWTLSAKVSPPFSDTQSFGQSVSVDGNHVSVGDPLQEKAYVFVRDTPGDFTTSDWSLEATIETDDEENHGYFGSNVVIKNEILIVAAPGDPTHASNQRGAVLVFSRDTKTNTWEQTKGILSPDMPQGKRDEFGRSLAFDGSTLVVGAYHDEHDVKGAAYVFSVDERSTGSSDTLTTAVPSPPPNATAVLPSPPPPPRSLVLKDYESSAARYSIVTALVISIVNLYITTKSR
tara:strand:- start:7 stop:2268 length:2262 start_codon:yes stop_codon:yes gene_type:complete